jgi:hypothetical protein
MRRARRGLVLGGPLLALAATTPVAAAQRRWTPGAFAAVQTELAAELELVAGTTPGVSAEAESAVLDRLRAEVRAGVLHLESTGAWQTRRPVRLRVEYTALQALRLGGTVDARLRGLRAAEFDLRCSDSAGVDVQELQAQACQVVAGGSGTVRLAGRCKRLALEAGGSGDVFAAGLASDEVRVRAVGSATVEVAAAVTLDANVAGAATVRYRGRPKVTQRVGDAGTLETI